MSRQWIFCDDEIGLAWCDDSEEERTIEAFEYTGRELRLLWPEDWGGQP